MTNKNSHDMVMKMKLEKQIRKSIYPKGHKYEGKLKSYEISIGKNDISEDDEKKFYQNDKGLFVYDVVICSKDDFHAINQENKDLKLQIKHLQDNIHQLEAEIDEKSQSNKSSTSEYYEKLDEMKKRNSDLKQKHENEMSAITEDHQKNIESLADEFNEKIEGLKQIIASKDELIKENEAKYQDEIHHIKEDYSGKASSFSQKISNLENQNLQEINNLEKSQSDEISELKENHANEILELEKTHQDDVLALNQELSSIKLNHEKEINELKQSHKDEVSELKQNQFNKEYHMKISDHNKEISKVKDYLVKLRVKDHQDNIRFASDFEDLGFFEKHTSKFTDIIKEMKETDEKKLLKIDEDFSKFLLDAPDDDNHENE